jgi:hypothetical protein
MKTLGLFMMGIGALIFFVSSAVGRAAANAYTSQSLGAAIFAIIGIAVFVIGFLVWIFGPKRDDENIRPLV